MKAATIGRYGSPGVIEVRDVPAPVPGPDEVLVRVHAASVNRTDCGELLHPTLVRLLTGGGRSRRKILGMDFAGTIEAVGPSASRFKPGDRVFGMCPLRNEGAQADYLCMAETGPIAQMPSNLRFDQAVRRGFLRQSEGQDRSKPVRPCHRSPLSACRDRRCLSLRCSGGPLSRPETAGRPSRRNRGDS